MKKINKEEIEKILDLTINDIKFYYEAFTHSSFLNENKGWPYLCNERLEFLGDAVLELCVTEFLFQKYQNEPEGKLTFMRSSLVNTNILIKICFDLGLYKYLYLSKGEVIRLEEFLSKKDLRIHKMADLFEATVGAIYLDRGKDVAFNFILKNILPYANNEYLNNEERDAKTSLQEKIQEICSLTPEYIVLKETGPAHKTEYEVGVYVKEILMGKGIGVSKKEAQEKAAIDAWNNFDFSKLS